MDRDDGIDRLMRIQVAVDQEFWLTLPELLALLGIPSPPPAVLSSSPTGPQGFTWRNFACTPVPAAPDFWQVSRHPNPLTPPLTSSPLTSSPLTSPQMVKHTSRQPDPGSLAAEFVQIEQFLPPDLVAELLHLALDQQPYFVPTGVTTQDRDYRQSLFLPSFIQTSIWPRILHHIEQVMPAVMASLGIPVFPIADIESQLTAHNDGNYYKIHNDNGSPPTATRVFTYVYYFHRDPKAFLGGELKIFDTIIENNFYVGASSFSTVQPTHNSIVFFLSRYLHEVLEVQCPSRLFANSRFTVNGWIRSQQPIPV